MKNLRRYIALLIGVLIVTACSVKEKDKPVENNKGRNLFGHYIPRGLTKTSEGLADGYVMFTVPNSSMSYLVNRKGEVVHQWKGNYSVDTSVGYLLDDGSLIQCAMDPDYPVFGHGGPYGRIQKITWDSKMLWDFEYANEKEVVHHDIAVLPNGNILAIAYELTPYDEAIAFGRKPDMVPKDGPWLEKIIEVEPQGRNAGKIVWEWHLKDHLIQDFDPSKRNYGIPKDHPELLDFNKGNSIPPAISQDSLEILQANGMAERNDTPGSLGADLYHFNAINYNAALDQIVISSPHLNEIFILDHGTTTAEAAGHSGGKRGKGGDFLYRWGNPENYHRGDSVHQQLFGQHDVRWIEDGKPGAGHLSVYNNHPPGEVDFVKDVVMGIPSKNYSAVYEIETPVDNNGNYLIEEGQTYGPEKPTWVYVSEDTLSFYSPFISGAHRMNNGNTFINEGARGRFFEVTSDGKVVWEYLNPYRGEIREPNGDPVNVNFLTYSQFRATFIPANHPAFAGKELKPLDPQPKPFVMPPPPKEEKKM